MAKRIWQSARRLLCVRLDSLGDVLMSTPAIRALKRSIARSRVTLLTSPAGAQLAGLVPDVDEFLVYEAPWVKATPPRSDPASDQAMIALLRRGRFDAAVIFTVFSQNPLPAAMLCYLAGIPLRLAHCHENPYQLLTDWVPDDEPHQRVRHEVRRQLDLVAAIGCRSDDERLTLAVPQRATGTVRAKLARRGWNPDGRWLVIHPGASAPSRRYPPEHFARVAAELIDRHGFQVVLSGTEAELALAEEIRAGLGQRVFSLVGQLPLGEFAALVAMAPLVLTNNTGPVHVAAALGTPVVDLYALTNPQHAPWKVPHRLLYCDVPCRYCFKSVCPMGHHQCLRAVAPEAVVAAVLELYEEASVMRTPTTDTRLPPRAVATAPVLAGAPITV